MRVAHAWIGQVVVHMIIDYRMEIPPDHAMCLTDNMRITAVWLVGWRTSAAGRDSTEKDPGLVSPFIACIGPT